MFPADGAFRWEDNDERLLSAESNDLAEEMSERSKKAESEIDFETQQSGNSAGYLPRLFELHEQLTDEWAERLYALHCKIWRLRNRPLSAVVIRAIRDAPIAQMFAARKSSLVAWICRRAARIGEQPNSTSLAEWGRRMDRLATRWNRRLEAEAIALEVRASVGCQTKNLPSGLRPSEESPFLWVRRNRSVILKLVNLAEEFTRKIDEGEHRIRFQNRLNLNESALPFQLLRMRRELIDERAHRAEEIYRRTWREQGHRETGVFIRAVCAQILSLISVRASLVEHDFQRFVKSTNFQGGVGLLKGFQFEIRRLQGRWQRRLESEALDFEAAQREISFDGTQGQDKSHGSTNVFPKAPERDSAQKIREAVIHKVQNPQSFTIVSIPEAALYFEVQPRTVYRWIADGKLKSGVRRGSITIKSVNELEKKRSRKRRDT